VSNSIVFFRVYDVEQISESRIHPYNESAWFQFSNGGHSV
jgi:hypothetical protein